MTTEEIKNTLYRIVGEVLEIDNIKECLDEEGNFKDIELTSVNYLKIIVAIEEEFEIEFDDELLDFESFLSIDSLCSYIKENVEK